MSGMPNWARVGVKVVCVNGADWIGLDGPPHTRFPTLNEILTISDVFDDGFATYLAFDETGLKDTYNARRFRPAVSQQDDMELHFERLLDVPSDLEVA